MKKEQRWGFSNATVQMLVKDACNKEQQARKRFLSSGCNLDAEEWHISRNAKDELEKWAFTLASAEHSAA